MSDTPLSDWQVKLLGVVAEGGGELDARQIDLRVSSRYSPGESTVLRELESLQRLGLVVRDDSRSGVGGRWKVTEAARPYIQLAAGAEQHTRDARKPRADGNRLIPLPLTLDFTVCRRGSGQEIAVATCSWVRDVGRCSLPAGRRRSGRSWHR